MQVTWFIGKFWVSAPKLLYLSNRNVYQQIFLRNWQFSVARTSLVLVA